MHKPKVHPKFDRKGNCLWFEKVFGMYTWFFVMDVEEAYH